MKKWLTVLSLIVAIPAMSQDFSGYRSGNYTGVNGVFFNPANIADSRYRFDVNLFSINVLAGNDQAKFKLKDVVKNTFDGDTLKKQVFGKNAGASSGMLNMNILGPSVMFNLNKKSSIALTTRVRSMVNIRDIDGKLADKLLNDFEDDQDLPYTISSNEDQQLAVHGWAEFGLSYARVIKDDGKHFLKGGFTAKYLAGAASAYMNIGKLNGTLNEDVLLDEYYLNNTTGRIGMGFGGVNISDIKADDMLKMESTGFGADIGFIYEFRPDHENHKFGENDAVRRDVNKYKFRAGVALLDIGKINYKRDVARSGTYDINVTGAERLSLTELGEQDFDKFKEYFTNHPQYFTEVAGLNGNDYDVALPTTLQIDLDYNVNKGIYVSLASQISLAKSGASKPYNTQYYNSFTLTPRYEGRVFGVYVPVNYNELTKLNAGLSLRCGPLFVGSGSVLTAMLGDSRQADVYMGLRFGGLHKNKFKKWNKKNKQEASQPAVESPKG